MNSAYKSARNWARYWGIIFYTCFAFAVFGTTAGILYEGEDWIRGVFFTVASIGLVFSVSSSEEHDRWKATVKEYESK